MIRSRTDLDEYIKLDMRANGVARWGPLSRFEHPVIHWLRHLRSMEYANNVHTAKWKRPYLLLCRVLFRMHSIKLGFSIPLNVFGPGLMIPHWGTIVVNHEAKIGRNCRLHAGTCIGGHKGGAPHLGNDCYIGPGAKLFGDIRLGNGVHVGANAVVTKSFGDNATLVGIPAANIKSSLQARAGQIE